MARPTSTPTIDAARAKALADQLTALAHPARLRVLLEMDDGGARLERLSDFLRALPGRGPE